MKKIKLAGIVIFVLSIILIFISLEINKKSKSKINIIEITHTKKTLVQAISKNTFYSYRQKSKSKAKDISTTQLDKSISKFFINIGKNETILKSIDSKDIKKQFKHILFLWNNFYYDVDIFKSQIKVTLPYTNVLLEKTVSKIFTKNIELILQFNKLIEMQKIYFDSIIHKYKQIQYILLFIVLLSTLYLFSQINIIISFLNKFSTASKKVIEDNSIESIEPIEVTYSNYDVQNATDNFNTLVNKINESIWFSTKSIEYTSKSLESIEKNIENFLIFLNNMNDNDKIDIEITKKEDAVIDSLDELVSLTNKLDNLKVNLDKLINTNKQ